MWKGSKKTLERSGRLFFLMVISTVGDGIRFSVSLELRSPFTF